MYFTSIPDHSDPSFNEELHFSQFRQHNIVFNAMSFKSCCDRHVGCLSIKTVSGGEEWYGVDNRQLVVRPGQFLLLNNDQEYSCRIDTSGEVRVQSVFFRKAFASSVFRDVLRGEAASLDNPFEDGGQCPEFFQAINDTDPWLAYKLQGLMTLLDCYGYNCDMVDEHLLFLLQHLISVHKQEADRVRRVSAVRQHTKTEIYRRLCIAKDFLHSSFTENADLGVISQTACLSIPQLVRQFKAVFRQTPHQYLTRIRLDHAAGLLKHTAIPIHEITWKCGFEDASAFCRAFKSTYGVPPAGYRSATNKSSPDGCDLS